MTKTGQLRHTAPLSVNMDALSTRVDIPTVVNVSVSPQPGPSKVRTSAPHCHGKHKPYALRRPQRYAKLKNAKAKCIDTSTDDEEPSLPDDVAQERQIASVMQLPNQARSTNSL